MQFATHKLNSVIIRLVRGPSLALMTALLCVPTVNHASYRWHYNDLGPRQRG
jgi:hypothetical protein